jgi:hypothetical protein
MFKGDSKRVFNWMIKDEMAFCLMSLQQICNLFEDRWKGDDTIIEELTEP